MVDKKKFQEALSKALEEKGKRKFRQSVELVVNMRGIDFSKSENRLNLDVPLPKGRGIKSLKVAVVGDEPIVSEAKKGGAELTMLPTEIVNYAERSKLQDLAQNYILLAQPQLMAQVAKHLGQYLGPRGKLPRPIIGNLHQLIDRSRKSVRIVTKGKYLPTVHCLVGTEDMSPGDLLENAEAVYDAIRSKVSEGNVRSIYVKLTMGKPVRVI